MKQVQANFGSRPQHRRCVSNGLRIRWFAAALMAGLLYIVAPLNADKPNEDGTLFMAHKVYTMAGDAISPGQVLVVDGKIKAVGESVLIAGTNPTVVKLGEDSVLMPGLVDAYSQTGLGADGTDEITDELTPRFRAASSIDLEKRELKRQRESGTTTMCVCPGRQNVVAGISAIVKTAETDKSTLLTDNGPLVATMCSDPASRNFSRARPDSIYVRQPTNRMGVVWILRNTFDKAKRGSDDPKLVPIKEVLDGTRPLMMYARLSYDLNTVGTLADEFGLKPVVVGGHESYKVKETLAERKYPVILDRIGTGDVRGAEGSELCWNVAGILDEAGITFALSGNDLLEQARFAVRHGLDRDAALAAITSTPASILGIEKQVGSIVVDHDADLIAFSGDPLETTSSIRFVMINGEIVSGEILAGENMTEDNKAETKNNSEKLDKE